MPKEGRQGKKARKETRREDGIEQHAVFAQSQRSTGAGQSTHRVTSEQSAKRKQNSK